MIKNDSNNLNFSGIGNLKYPTSRLEYSFHTGELAENVITTIVKNILPYTEIPYHNVVVNGSDLKIYYHGKLLAKFEILNFDSRSYINSKRALSIKQNLKGVKYKGVICSFFNATSRAKEILKNIPVCTIGFQLLPSKFHQYYVRLNKVHHRRIANNRSLKQLKNTLKSFFHRIGLDLLMYVSRISRTRISNTINLKNTNFNIDVKNIETENRRARTEEKTESSTSGEYTVSPISVGTEKCSSFDSTSDNISVEREKFLNETLSRYPLLKQNKIKSPKECPNRKYRIVVCSLKMLNPSYVCIFRVLYHIRHNNFPPYIERRGKIYICKNPKCTGEVCKTLDLTCSFLVGINKCPRMYKPPHFCLPLPKPKILPSPDLTYYFKEMNRK
jgi:uncharacterized alkaline shock family protein YloU